MNVPKENQQYSEVLSLIKWAFDSFGEVELIHEGDEICSVDVRLSDETDSLALYAASGFSGYFPKDILDSPDLMIRYSTTETALEAPVEAGEVAGNLTVLYRGKIIASIPLVTKDAVAQSGFLGTMDSIQNLTGKRWFRAAVICAVVLLCIYGAVLYLLYRRKRNRRKKQLAMYARYTGAAYRTPAPPRANGRTVGDPTGRKSSAPPSPATKATPSRPKNEQGHQTQNNSRR